MVVVLISQERIVVMFVFELVKQRHSLRSVVILFLRYHPNLLRARVNKDKTRV